MAYMKSKAKLRNMKQMKKARDFTMKYEGKIRKWWEWGRNSAQRAPTV